MNTAATGAGGAGGRGDALTRLREQQRQIEDLFTAWFEHQRDPGYRDAEALRLATLIITLLRVQDELESGVLQPALASVVGAPPLLADAATQRAEVDVALERVESLGESDPARDGAMRNLEREVSEWFEASERSLYALARDSGLDLVKLDTELATRQEALLSGEP